MLGPEVERVVFEDCWGSDGCAGTANKIQFFMAIWYRCCERLYELAQLIAEYVVVVLMRSKSH